MCNGNTRYLLEGDNEAWISNKLCALNNNKLASFFILVSSQINFSHVKDIVYSGTSMSDLEFIVETLKAAEAAYSLQTVNPF